MTAVLVYFDSDGESNCSYQHGEQFLPGPLFLQQNDQSFANAYYKDAQKAFLPSLDVLHMAAFHQDMKFAPPGVLPEIRKQLKRLDRTCEVAVCCFAFAYIMAGRGDHADLAREDALVSTLNTREGYAHALYVI